MVKLNRHGDVLPLQWYVVWQQSLDKFFCKCVVSGQLCRCVTELQIHLIWVFFPNGLYSRSNSGCQPHPQLGIIIKIVSSVLGQERVRTLSIGRPHLHTTNPWKEEKEKIAGDKKKEQIKPTGKH